MKEILTFLKFVVGFFIVATIVMLIGSWTKHKDIKDHPYLNACFETTEGLGLFYHEHADRGDDPEKNVLFFAWESGAEDRHDGFVKPGSKIKLLKITQKSGHMTGTELVYFDIEGKRLFNMDASCEAEKLCFHDSIMKKVSCQGADRKAQPST